MKRHPAGQSQPDRLVRDMNQKLVYAAAAKDGFTVQRVTIDPDTGAETGSETVDNYTVIPNARAAHAPVRGRPRPARLQDRLQDDRRKIGSKPA